MIRLYSGGGSQEVQVLDKVAPDAAWFALKKSIVRLLQAKYGEHGAASILDSTPFELREGTNGFNDEFSILYYKAPLEPYVQLAESCDNFEKKQAYRQIAEAVTEAAGYYIRFIVLDFDPDVELGPIATPSLELRSDAVERALADAEQLIHSRGAASGVDRVHTAFHGYLKAVAAKAVIECPEDAGVTELFKVLRQQHPALALAQPRGTDMDRIIRSISAILDALNPVRNRASIAHPNELILEEPEAMLVINSVKTLLHYLDAKLRASSSAA